MPRPVTLFTGQWADLPFEEVCRLAREWGYDGLEIACWGDHFDVDKALDDDAYVAGRADILEQARPEGVRDLQPPDRAGRVRPPDRRAAPGHPARPGSGATATRRVCGSGPPRR